jgi:hypothetical protein
VALIIIITIIIIIIIIFVVVNTLTTQMWGMPRSFSTQGSPWSQLGFTGPQGAPRRRQRGGFNPNGVLYTTIIACLHHPHHHHHHHYHQGAVCGGGDPKKIRVWKLVQKKGYTPTSEFESWCRKSGAPTSAFGSWCRKVAHQLPRLEVGAENVARTNFRGSCI